MLIWSEVLNDLIEIRKDDDDIDSLIKWSQYRQRAVTLQMRFLEAGAPNEIITYMDALIQELKRIDTLVSLDELEQKLEELEKYVQDSL